MAAHATPWWAGRRLAESIWRVLGWADRAACARELGALVRSGDPREQKVWKSCLCWVRGDGSGLRVFSVCLCILHSNLGFVLLQGGEQSFDTDPRVFSCYSDCD